ncbi:polyprotein, partial [Globisporangium polare]
MEVDAVVKTAPWHRATPRSTNSRGPLPPSTKTLTCFRCRKVGHRAADCRAPAPVLAAVDARGEVSDSAYPGNAEHHPAALRAQLNATTSSSDKRLIVLSLHVDGAKRPLRALLDSGATNNFVRADSLSLLPSRVRTREQPGGMVVKYADGAPRKLPRRSVSFEYEFDGFESSDEFLVIELSGSFDCIFGMPWLARHQPDVDWLNLTVKPRDIDVNAVLAILNGHASNWPHVAVVDPDSTTLISHGESDGPPCVACFNASCAASVEQRLLRNQTAPEQWLTVRRERAAARPRKNTASSQWQTTLEVKNEPKVIARPAGR